MRNDLNKIFRNRTIEDLAIQYVLMTGPNPPTKLYSAKEVYSEIVKRCCENNLDDIGYIKVDLHIEKAKDIMKMIDG